MRAAALQNNTLESKDSKLKAFIPAGGTAGIPQAILDAQFKDDATTPGGEVLGIKCVGAFIAAPTAHGAAGS